jgi:peroxiredoxin
MDIQATLATELAELKASSKARVSAERFAMVEAAIARLKIYGVEGRALGAGDLAPDVAPVSIDGHRVRLRDLWRSGPLVIVFYRGGWCPYCNLQLRAWQKVAHELARCGAGIVAISPQPPDHSISTAGKHGLGFAVLSDAELEAAEAFKIVYTLPDELIDLYGRLGHDLPVLNGNGRWALPMTATYVIDRRGIIVFADVDADYRRRAEPADVLAHLKTIEAGSVARS